MIRKQIQINEEFIKYAINVFTNGASEYIEIFRNALQVDNAIHINFQIDNSQELNAYANGCYPKYKIVIFSGIIYGICDLFKLLMEHEDAIGIIEQNNEYVSKDVMYDKVKFCAKLVSSTIRYVTLHEFSHIVLGHLDWIKINYKLDKLEEYGGNEGLDATSFHALENHADATAMGPLVIANSLDTYYAGIGITFIFNLLINKQESIRNYASITHPHPYVRWASLYSLISVNIKEKIISEGPGNGLLIGMNNASRALRSANLDNLLKPIVDDYGPDEASNIVSKEYQYTTKRLLEIAAQLKPLHGLNQEMIKSM